MFGLTGRFLLGVALSGILAPVGPSLNDPSVVARIAAAEGEMVRTVAAETAIDASAVTLGGLQSLMRREGEMSGGGGDSVAVVWWEGAVSARFQAGPLVRYLPAFLGKRFLDPDAVASRLDLRLSPRCAHETEQGTECGLRWERSKFPGTVFGLSPGMAHEEALRRVAVDPEELVCKNNATWVEGDPEVLIRRACQTSLGDDWSLMWQEDRQFEVTNVSAWRRIEPRP